MITHDQVKSEVQFLDWQIAAWQRVQEKNFAAMQIQFAAIQIQYLQKRIDALKDWDSERWESR